MRLRLPALSYHTRLTLTIAAAFIGAMIVILVLALAAARSYDLAIISASFETMPAPEAATPPAIEGEPSFHIDVGERREPPDAPDAPVPGAVYVVDEAGSQGQLVQLPEERFPTLIRWALATLAVFALVAVALATWISRRSLGRIAGITTLARGLSERHLDQRLNLTGPNDEIKQLGDTFDGMLERLERVFANQSLFIANASHELRTPLTTTRAALEIPLAQGRVPDDLRPSLEQALNANRRSETLIEALLLLARGQLGPTGLREVDLQDVVRSTLEAVNHEARSHGVTINTDLAPATVRGDPTLLAQAVTNLVQNAVRHNVEDGEAWVSLAALPDGARLTIGNTGAPHSPETVSRMVEPFHRGDATRLSGPTPAGFGLGLAIVQSVASMHGGSLTLIARDGGGLVATLDLPGIPPLDETAPNQ